MTDPTPPPLIRETDGHALAVSIAKAAGWRECPNALNTVCCCPTIKECQQKKAAR